MERQALLFPQPPDDPSLPAYAINDMPGVGGFNFGPMEQPQGIVIHHTGGGGTPDGVMNTFQQRGLATQFIMDRDGNVVRALPEGMRGQHIRPSQINGLTNANTLGIEIIAKDDSDVTEKQRDAAARWLTEQQAAYGIPAANVFGHGELNSHKQATEGSTVVNNWRAANRIATPDLGPPAAGGNLPMEQRTLMAYAGRDARRPPQNTGETPFEREFQAASAETGIPVAILKAQTQQESAFNPRAIGRSGEVGLLQIKPSTAQQPGFGLEPVDPNKLADPAENIRFGARYLAARANAAGVTDWNDPGQVAKGLTAYNGGGDPNYANNVLRFLNRSGGPATGSQPASRQPNTSLVAAAERGRGPAADRIARGANIVQGQAPMARPMPPDLSNAQNAGALDFILREAGQAPDMQPSAAGQGNPDIFQRMVGGLGGLGGMKISESAGGAPQGGGAQSPGTQSATVESLMPFSKPFPLAVFGPGLAQNQKAEQEHRGAVLTAKQFVAQGMSPQDAVAAVYAPDIGQKLALGTLQQQKDARDQQAVRQRVYGGQTAQEAPSVAVAPTVPQTDTAPPTGSPATARPGDAAMLGGQPAIAPPAAPTERLTTKLTVDTLLRDREQVQREMEKVYAVPTTPASKGIVEARIKALEGRLGNIDKNLDQYGTGPLKEYTAAMRQRTERGEPLTPFEKWDPENDRKSARGPQPDEIAGYRKEVQALPSYKNVTQAIPIYKSMLETVDRNTKASDLNLVYGLGKIMDPTSVVREGEMVMVKNSAGLSENLLGAIKALTGGAALTPVTRKALMDEAHSRMQAYKGVFDNDASQYKGIVQQRGINEALVLPNFEAVKPYEPPKKVSEATPAPGSSSPLQEVPAQYVRPDGSSPPMPSAPPPPKAFTKSDWDKLEPGALYLDAKGDTRRKGGN